MAYLLFGLGLVCFVGLFVVVLWPTRTNRIESDEPEQSSERDAATRAGSWDELPESDRRYLRWFFK